MGNGIGKLTLCFTGDPHRPPKDPFFNSGNIIDDSVGRSFCYVRPDPTRITSSKVHSDEETTTFRTISGASVSANTSTPPSTSFVDSYSYASAAADFESSTSFYSIPLQPIPRNLLNSGPLMSGPIEKGFLSGPIGKGFMSGPLDRPGLFSGPLDRTSTSTSYQFQRSFSHTGFVSRKRTLIRVLQRAISKTIHRVSQNSIVAPIKGTVKEPEWLTGSDKPNHNENLTISSSEGSTFLEDDDSSQSQNLQWAQGKAGEDRVHVVVSEEHGWVFVGIYDGFNGPDAPDYLLSNLYSFVHKELKGLLWDDEKFIENSEKPDSSIATENRKPDSGFTNDCATESCLHCIQKENSLSQESNSRKNIKRKFSGAAKKWEENQRRWRCEWDRERLELDRRLKEQMSRDDDKSRATNHNEVLKALSMALRKTEESYFDVADKVLDENPELALMGSCVLVMLMKGEDVYLMNVGDSRAVLAQRAESDCWLGKIRQDLERINEETMHDLVETSDGDKDDLVQSLTAFQLTVDHSTSVEEEVERIKNEHPDDAYAVMNDRVKGSLKVTRAFGAGFLKQPKWNNAILEMFRIDYKGTSPYINCLPSLYHHKLGSKDRFLILSSDGLYQYFTNEEAVSEVELFIAMQPEGDPAQHLVEELLFRAAQKAGMDFYELLEIPHGDRRRYHDDVSIIVISLEGRIWRSCV